MATTLDTYLPFDSGPGANVTETGWRDMMKHMLGSASGIVRGFDNDFSTIGDATGMQVKVSSGQCFIRAHYGRNASTRTIAIAASHATLNRRDLVILRCDFVNNRIEIDVLTGTPSGSPVAPSLTTNTSIWETLLAEVTVNATDTSISAGEVIDRRQYTMSFAKYSRNSLQTVNSSSFTDVVYNTTLYASGDVVLAAAGSLITLSRAGLYTITAQHAVTGQGAGTSGGRGIQIVDASNNAITETTVGAVLTASINTYVQATCVERFPAGQQIKVRAWQNSGVPLSLVADQALISIVWVGP